MIYSRLPHGYYKVLPETRKHQRPATKLAETSNKVAQARNPLKVCSELLLMASCEGFSSDAGREEATEAWWRCGGSLPCINQPPGGATKAGGGCGAVPRAAGAERSGNGC